MLGGAEVLSGVEDKFDIVAANINRNIIVADLYRWGSLMTENGIMILSGFFEEDVAIIEKEAKKYRLKISDCKVQNPETGKRDAGFEIIEKITER
jgi:ribosomal protein L11 methyltransferase